MRGKLSTLEIGQISIILGVRLRMKFRIRMARTRRVRSWQAVILRLLQASHDLRYPHKKMNYQTLASLGIRSPGARGLCCSGNLTSGEKRNLAKVAIIKGRILVYTGHDTSVCSIGQSMISQSVDPLSILTLCYVPLVFWTH